MTFDPDQPVEIEVAPQADQPTTEQTGFDPDKPVEIESDVKPISLLGGQIEVGARGVNAGRNVKKGLLSGAAAYGEGIRRLMDKPVKALENLVLSPEEAKRIQDARDLRVTTGNTAIARAQRAAAAVTTDPELDKTALSQTGNIAGRAVPVVLGGPIGAPLAGGLQMGGEAALNAEDQGMSEEEQQRRFGINATIGTALNAVPGLASGPTGQFLKRVLPGVSPLTVRGAQAVAGAGEGALVNATGDAAVQYLETGKVDTDRLKQNAGLGAVIGAAAGAMHTPSKGKAPKFNPDETVVTPKEDTPLLTPQSEAPAAELPKSPAAKEVPSFNPDEPISTTPQETAPKVEAPVTAEPVKAPDEVPNRKVTSAAIQMPDGSIRTGHSHAEIIYNMSEAERDALTSGAPGVEYKDGFMTSDGKFVSRDEAAAIGKTNGQLDAAYEPTNKERGAVQSEDFNFKKENVKAKPTRSKTKRASLDDDAAIEAAAEAQARPAVAETAAPTSDYQYTVWDPSYRDKQGRRVVQVDEIANGESLGSQELWTRKANGEAHPEIPDDMPVGRYTSEQLKAEIEKLNKGKPAQPLTATPQPSVTSKEKLTIRTRDGSTEVEVTPEQKAAYLNEKNWLKETQAQIRAGTIGDAAQKQSQLKRVAMQSAARVRQILEMPTAKEASAAAEDAMKLRAGRPVTFTDTDGTLAKGVVEKAPAFGKVTIKREDGAIVRMSAGEAKVVLPAEAAPKLERPALTGERQPPLGREPQNRQELVYELSRYTKGAEQVVQAFEKGNADMLIKAADGQRGLVGIIQSTYMQMKKLGLIPAHIDRQIKTALLNENRDLFSVFDSAPSTQAAGIVAIPNVPAPKEILDAAVKTSQLSWKAAKNALFNTTGGISKYIFDLMQDVHGRNARMVEEVKRMSYAISDAFGGELTPEVNEIASTYLNPTRLNKMDPQTKLRIQKAMASMTDAQKDALNTARDRIDKMTQEIVALGIPKKEFSEIMRANLGRYVSRSYKIFSSGAEDYIRALTTEGTDAYKTRYLPAVNQFGKDFVDKLLNLIKRRSDLNRVEIDSLVRDQIKGLGSSVALDRTVREQTIRDLFGEVVDPVQSVAYTLIKQQELASTFKFRQKVADDIAELGLGRKIDPDKIVQDYIANEAAVLKEGADARVAEATKARASKGMPMTPEIEKSIRDQYAVDRPTYSARVEARTKALMTDAVALGEKADLAKATRTAEREVFTEYEDNAMEWYNRSGEVQSGETMVRQDPIYKANMAMSGRVNDPFAGLVVKNEALPLLAEYQKLQPQAMNLLQEMATITNTGATVLSPMTTARNIITSNQTILASGNLLRSVTTEAGRNAWGDAMAIAKHLATGSTLPKELSGLYNELMEAGVLSKGALSGDTANIIASAKGLGSRLGKVGRILKAEERLSLDPLLEKSRRLRPEEAIAKMAWGNEAGWEKLARKSQDIYQLGDNAPKIVNYMIEKAKAIEAYGNTPQALAEAQRKFGMTNYDYSKVIPFIRAIRKFPVIGGFTSFISETYRTAINSVGLAVEDSYRGIKTGNKALVRQGMERMLGVSVALGGAAIAAELSRDALGLTYEDDRELKKFLPEWDRNSHIVWYRQGDGKVGYINLGNSQLFSAVTRPAFALVERMMHGEVEGDPSATLGNEIKTQFWNVVQPFVSWQIGAQAMKEAVTGTTQAGVPIWAADDGEGDKLVKSAWHVMQGVLTPGFVRSGKPVVQGALGRTDRFGDPIDPAKPIMALLGVGEIDGKKALKYYSRDQNRVIRGIEGEFKRMTEDMTTGITEDTLYDKLQEVEDRRREYFNNLHLSANQALQMGVPQATVIAQLKDQGFDTREIAAILRGRYEPYMPSTETMQRARKAGRPLNFKMVRDIVNGSRD